MEIKIRRAEVKDFDALYELGCQTPEFKVSSNNEFMEPEEFVAAIENPSGTLLLAEVDGKITGFIYANRQDLEQAHRVAWACLVYLVVQPEFRKNGVAQMLYDACVADLKKHDITNLYAWANSESDGSILKFMEKNGFSEGHKYVWMDKKI